MKLLYLADAIFADKPGGSRTAALETARCLAARGHEVTFLVGQVKPDTPGEEMLGDIRVVRTPLNKPVPLSFAQTSAEVTKKYGLFDAVHTHFAWAGLGPLRLGKSLRGVPHVRTYHGPWCEEGWVEDQKLTKSAQGRIKAQLRRSFRHWVEAENLKDALAVTVLSDFMADSLKSHFGLNSGKIVKIEGGGDVARFDIPKDKAKVRAELGLPSDRPILLTVRRLAARMGIDNLIRAVAMVRQSIPSVFLVIGGRGPEQGSLESLAAELGVTDNIRFAGFIPDGDLAGFYGAADLFVLPTSALEGFGLVITESLACGTPVLGTPVGAIPEVISPLEPRLLSQDASAEAIAGGIIDFLQGSWRSALTPERLRRYVLDNYTWERAALRTEQLYMSLQPKLSTAPVSSAS